MWNVQNLVKAPTFHLSLMLKKRKLLLYRLGCPLTLHIRKHGFSLLMYTIPVFFITTGWLIIRELKNHDDDFVDDDRK